MSPLIVFLVLGLSPVLSQGFIQSSDIEKPGTCPADIDFPTCEDGINSIKQCEEDFDCKGKSKCCVYRCGKQCVLPLEGKKNPCPAFNASNCSAKQRESSNECHNDAQCPGSERCCCADCVRKCTPTMKVKPGQCPAAKLKCLSRIPKAQCENDEQCPEQKKCCNMCGKICVDPIKEHRGFCPVSLEQASCSAPLEKVLCRRDVDCGQKQKCCLSDNKMACVDSVEVKNGECPAPLAKCAYPPPPSLCTGDSDCPGSKKCCSPLCRMECTDPIIDKPGNCPVVNTILPCPTPYPTALCETDVQCLGRQKCCDYACRQQCTNPALHDSSEKATSLQEDKKSMESDSGQ